MRKEMLEKRRRIFGEDYLNTISAMNNLAVTLGAQGQLDEAAGMMQKVIYEIDRIFGEEYLKARITKTNLILFAEMEASPEQYNYNIGVS